MEGHKEKEIDLKSVSGNLLYVMMSSCLVCQIFWPLIE